MVIDRPAHVMTSVELVGLLVRQWAEDVVPDHPAVVDRAVSVAQHSYASGGSVGDACWLARRYVECWSEHPANRRHRSVPLTHSA